MVSCGMMTYWSSGTLLRPRKALSGWVSSLNTRSRGSLARAIRRRPQKKTIMSLAKRWRQQLRNVIALYRSRKNLVGFVTSIVKMRKGNEVRIVDGNLESPPEPVKQVTFRVFDDDQEWEAIVNFYDTPVDLVQDTIELVVEVIEKAKLEDAGS